MSKMGQELDRKLNENKYEMWEVLQYFEREYSITFATPRQLQESVSDLLWETHKKARDILYKIGGKDE